MSVSTGLYTLFNVAGRSMMDLAGGSPGNGTQIQGWSALDPDDPYAYDQFWFIAQIPGTGAYTVYNLKTGTVVDLNGGSNINGAKVQGWTRTLNPDNPIRHNQEWIIKLDSSGAYIFFNIASGTCLDLAGGGSANGTKVQGWQWMAGNPNQQWILKPRTTPRGMLDTIPVKLDAPE